MLHKEQKKSTLQLLCSVWTEREYLRIVLPEAVGVVLACLMPMAQKYLIDSINCGDRHGAFTALAVLAVCAAVIAGCVNLVRILKGRAQVLVKRRLKLAVFRHLLNLPEAFLQSRGAGYFFNRLQADVNEAAVFLGSLRLTLWADILKLLLAVIIIAFIRWPLALVLLPFIAVQWMVCFAHRRRRYRLSHSIQECVATERNMMLDYLSNRVTVKTNVAADFAADRIRQGITRWQKLMFRRLSHENMFIFRLRLPLWICFCGVLLWGLHNVLELRWSPGELWAVLILLRTAFAPAGALGGEYFQMQSSLAAWDRLHQLLGVSSEYDECREKKAAALTGEIVFEHISFEYDSGCRVFRDLTFSVPAGGLLFITGSNGSGKSTLLALLLQLYCPASGRISIGGCDISDFDLQSYRSRISYIGQYPELFAGTVRENLCVGRDIEENCIYDALKQTGCLDFLESRNGGLDAAVAENGDNFSGGQRLRLVLAREILRDTDILLCDEAAANLDRDGRQLFYKLLKKVAGHKTVVAVVHDVPAGASDTLLQLDNLKNGINAEIK